MSNKRSPFFDVVNCTFGPLFAAVKSKRKQNKQKIKQKNTRKKKTLINYYITYNRK